MKKGIKIFKHNKEAFEKVLKAFETSSRTCVIHPTGTGKMFIALQLMDKFKNKRIAYITSYISIIDKLISDMEMTEVKVKNLYTEVYCNLKPSSGFDYIILDEFHHAGAPIWGANVKELIELNPDAKVLGLSATPIRFLDNNRDMADELFDNNVASYMKLEKAIVDDILQFPTYVTAVYEFDNIIEKYNRGISRIKNSKVSDAREKLEKARRTLENAEGIEEVVEKYITNINGRYIVFCRNFEHLDLMTKECSKWMHNINPNITIYTIKSDIDSNVNRKTLSEFENNTDDSLKLLFCVDMLNEGIHVKNDGCIMLRPTESYNVYLQQLGRVLAVGHESGVVLDIVNNIENLNMVDELKNNISSMSPNNKIKKYLLEKFKTSEKVKKAKEVLNELDDIIYDNTGWEVYYRYAKDYYEKHGNLLIPERYIIDNLCLGHWLRDQRENYKNSILSEERINLLDSIGMIWDVLEYHWRIRFNLAKDYYEKHGNLLIPQGYIIDDIPLGQWISCLRMDYKKSKISEERINLLNSIEMIWDAFDYKWFMHYYLAKDYYEKHGNLLVPQRYIINGKNLTNWITTQRENYRKSILSEEKINLLNSIGMVWNVLEYNWNIRFDLAKDYYEKHGNLLVPGRYIIGDIDLGLWIRDQRKNYRKSILSEEKINLLNSIGMIWDVAKYEWDTHFYLAKDYYEKHGNLLIPYKYVIDDIQLGKWMANLRNYYKKSILSEEKINLLNSIGMVWDIAEYEWGIRFNLAKDYYEKHGNLLVPCRYVIDDIQLGQWISDLRKRYKKGKLSKEQIEAVESIGMVWTTNRFKNK